MKRIKWKNVVVLIILIILTITLTISISNIVKWNIENKKTKNEIENIEKITKIEEIEDTETTEIIKQEEVIPEANPYWDYLSMSLISADFNELKNTNSDTKGWIQVNGTNINYPFVQSSDNKYYLNHSFNKTYNDAGWVFLDYRCDINNLGNNTIIYAHGRYDGTMFGTLKNILNSNWYNDPDNYVIKISSEKENTLWQVFSVYRIKTTSDYIKTEFSSNEYYQEFLDMLLKRSALSFNTTVNSNDKILTLSTCYNKDEKVVMHAKLIKKDIR